MLGSRYLSCAVSFALLAAVGATITVVRKVHTSRRHETSSVSSDENEHIMTTENRSHNMLYLHPQRQVHIAVLFRGESFRVKAHWRRTCDDNTFDKQKRFSDSHNRLFAQMAKLGINVDVFGATYACKNGRDYVDRLPEMYVPKMKALHILPYNGSTQLSTMAHVLRKTLGTGKMYDGIYLLRWDHDYTRSLTRISKSSCFVDHRPRQLNYFQDFGGIADQLLYVPGPYATRMLAFMELDASPCCKWPCARVCKECAKHFLAHLGVNEEKCSGATPRLRVLGCRSACLGSNASQTVEIDEQSDFETDEESGCYEPLGKLSD